MTSVGKNATKHFEVGDYIIGIAAVNKGRQGQVLEVLKCTGSKKFRVKWSNGEVGVCFVRGIQHRDQPLYFRGPNLMQSAVYLPSTSANSSSSSTSLNRIGRSHLAAVDEEHSDG